MAEVKAGRAATAALLAQLAADLGASLLDAVSAADMDEAVIVAAGLLPA
ncbi:MAG: hypothetical protein JO347_09925, partial [Candidatus Eremiobacteraeota bacterium]|nr:hypothetical protein [Candidatus Eremiobacteraeota bacterium]